MEINNRDVEAFELLLLEKGNRGCFSCLETAARCCQKNLLGCSIAGWAYEPVGHYQPRCQLASSKRTKLVFIECGASGVLMQRGHRM
jgi:hypothetical protein